MQIIGKTDKGIKREKNEDTFFETTEPIGKLKNLFVVCDGMGGHKAGEVASDLAVNALTEKIREESDEDDPVKILNTAISYANKTVFNRANSDASKSGMGTTMVVGTIEGTVLYVANVGDSRLYRASSEKLSQVTRDHSVVEELLRSGAITEDSAFYNAEKHKITRAIGAEKEVKAEFFKVQLSPDDTLLLCSDGLTNEVRNEEILNILDSSASLEDKAKTLIDTANKNGGHDNITVLLVKPF